MIAFLVAASGLVAEHWLAALGGVLVPGVVLAVRVWLRRREYRRSQTRFGKY